MSNPALENCTSCNTSAGATGSQGTNNSSTVKTNNDQDNFTYNEGKGVKDKIMLTGPMSEQYTQALAVVFAKKTTDDDGNEIPVVTPAQIASQPAVESLIMMDQMHMEQALSEVQRAAPAESLGEFYDYAQIEDDPDNVTVSGYFLSDRQALQPEIVEQVEQYVRDSNKRVIVVVVAGSSGINQSTHLKTKFIEVDTMGQQSMFDQDTDLSISREAHYDSKGITIVDGLRGFFKELQATAKRPAAA